MKDNDQYQHPRTARLRPFGLNLFEYYITESETPGRIFIQNPIGEGGDFKREEFEVAVGMTWPEFQKTEPTPELLAKVHKFFVEKY